MTEPSLERRLPCQHSLAQKPTSYIKLVSTSPFRIDVGSKGVAVKTRFYFIKIQFNDRTLADKTKIV